MKIAIKFGDNDFHSVWRHVIETLHFGNEYYGALPESKEELLEIINSISYGFYLLFQNQFEYNNDQANHYTHIKKYLIIDKSKLLLNEEVDDYLQDLNHRYDNSSTYILDTELYNNNTYCV